MGQRAAKKWERRAGPRWREERLRIRQAKRVKQAATFLKKFYAQFTPDLVRSIYARPSLP